MAITKLKKGYEAIKYVLTKELTKKGSQGLARIPGKAYDMRMKQLVDEMALKMKALGYDINKVTQKEVQGLLDSAEALAKQKKQKVISQGDPEFQGITDKLLGKQKPTTESLLKGEKYTDERGRVWDFGTKDRPFPGANLKAVPKTTVDEHITFIKSKEPIESMKEANRVIKREGRYKNLTEKESQKILKDTDDHIFQRDIEYDEFGDPIKPDPEDMASGGRVPLFKGKIAKGILSLGKKLKTKSKIPQKVEGKIWKNREGETQVIGMGDLASSEGMDTAVVKGMALSDAMKQMALDPSNLSDYNKFNELVEAGMGGFDPMIRQQILRAKYGDIVDEKLLKQMIATEDPQKLATVMGTIDEGMAMQQKGMHPDEIIETIKESWKRKTQAEGGRVPLMYGGDPGFAFEYGGSWADWHDQHRDQMPVEQYIKTKLPKDRLPFREMQSGGLAYMLGEPTYMKYGAGGSVGHAPWHKPTGQAQPTPHMDTPTPNIASKPDPMKAPRGIPSLAPKNMDPAYMQQRMMQQAMMGQGNTGQGPRPMAKAGGRIGFDKGKKVDLSKRRFLKGTGAAFGVLSMLPFVGKFFKPAAKAVGKFKGTPNLVVDITKTPNMPEWYIPVIKKVLNKGDDVTDTAATAERQRVHRDILPDGDEVTVTQNIDSQTIDVSVANPKSDYMSSSGAGKSPYTIQYAKGTEIGPHPDIPNALTTRRSVKEPDTLKVDEPYLNQVGPDTKDVEIEFDIMDYNLKKEVHDTSVLESYATGKKVKARGSGEVYDPYEGYSPDLKADDYAKGGLAHLLGE